MRIGSLFAGVGGLELGLEWALECETAWQVEQNEFCRSVLAKWWPDSRRFEKVEDCGAANLAPVDLICGGFPCQDTSAAGKGAGLTGARSGLWFEMARIVAELRPEWVVVENPASGATRWVDAVRSNLEQLDYACLPVPVAASECGASHRRARVFLVAHAENRTEQLRHSPRREVSSAATDAHRATQGNVDAEGDERSGIRRAPSDVDGSGLRLEPGRGSGTLGAEARIARHEARGSSWPWTESELDPVVHGLPGRLAERERVALGNSCTPQQAEVIGWVIRELLDAERSRYLAEKRAVEGCR